VEVAHIEAGLRSRDRTMPEEINRIVTDSVSDYFFVTERSGVDNLLREGKDHRNVYFVGHVMIDNLLYQVKKLRENSSVAPFTARLKLKHPRYGVVTVHRPSNVDNREILGQLIATLADISRELPLIFPMHPRTQSSIDRYRIDMPKTLICTGPLSYMEFLNLFMDAAIVLTDSGGIQEETTALGIPCLTLRENTERPITVSEGTNSLVGTDPSRIQSETRKILSGHSKTGSRPELWDGKAAHRIIEILATGFAC
ncbi:MAG: UDP-N-acetyl glucosamine 2-epimerase, partial [Gammaproteobacteria bacterium]